MTDTFSYPEKYTSPTVTVKDGHFSRAYTFVGPPKGIRLKEGLQYYTTVKMSHVWLQSYLYIRN